MSFEGFKPIKNENEDIANNDIKGDDILILERKKEIIKSLNDLLEEKSPDTFNSKWIEKNNRSLSRKINYDFNLGGGKVDWTKVLSLLDNKWKEKWEVKNRRNVQLPEIANDIIDAFKKENPDKISPEWINDKFNNNYQLLKKILSKKGHMEIDYQPLLDLLPSDIKEKWEVKNRRNVQLPEIADEIVDAFKKENPDKISPLWIENKMGNNYHALNKILHRKSNGGIDYQPLLDLLPSDIKEKWEIKRRNVQLPEIADEIVDAFKKENPNKISPVWLYSKINSNYQILHNILPKKAYREIDYQPLLDLLPPDIKEYWKPSLKIDDFIPKELYIDNKETDLVIDQHKDKMYTFYTFLDKEKDREAREDIIRDMRKIILKGNVDALDRLTEHLMFTVENWIEDDPKLKPWIYAQEKLKDIIKRCIYRHDENKGKFYSYLAVTIRKRIPNIITNSNHSNISVKNIYGNLDYYEEE